LLALTLARKGCKVGLFDLDFTSPSTHVILGVENVHPKEKNGIIPPCVHGLNYMSIIYYSGEYASPLRGADVSNVLIELLAITRWNTLDFLIIDMPPGIGDATLDVIRLVERIRFLIVTTSSQLTFETVGKLMNLLSELKIPVIGVIENMKMRESHFIQQRVEREGVTFWGDTPFDSKLEEAIGNADNLLKTEFGKKLGRVIAEKLKL
jgi:ATP-binding protein involved in chromosome partitioning